MVYCCTPFRHRQQEVTESPTCSGTLVLNYQQLFITIRDELLITRPRNPHKISDICHPERVMNQTL